jgi:hypothetical protein
MPSSVRRSTKSRQASSMLLALVPSGRFIGSLTAVAVSERSTGISVCVIGFPGNTTNETPAAILEGSRADY